MGSLAPAESDAAIPELVRASFARALEADDVYLYAAAAPPLRLDDDPKGFPQHAHLVPLLAEKPAVPPKTPDLRTRRERDVLEGPEYGKGEKILQLEQDGLDYALIHNLHALCELELLSGREGNRSGADFPPPSSSRTHDGGTHIRRTTFPTTDQRPYGARSLCSLARRQRLCPRRPHRNRHVLQVSHPRPCPSMRRETDPACIVHSAAEARWPAPRSLTSVSPFA